MKADFYFSLEDLTAEQRSLLRLLTQLSEPRRETILEASPWGITKTEKILGSLRKAGIVRTAGKETEGSGRKPNIYAFDKRCGFFLGAETNIAYDRLALTDWNGETLFEKEYPPSLSETGEGKIIDSLLGHIDDFLKIKKVIILAVTLAPYYFIDPAAGCVHIPMKEKRRHPLPVREKLAAAMKLPAYLTWPKVAVCYRKFRHTLLLEKKTFVNINLEYGVGMSLFHKGERYGGHAGIAGDFGHIVIPGNKRICYCGNRGCLRTILSFKGICELSLEREADNREHGIESLLDTSMLSGPDYKTGVDHLIALAKKNEKTAMKLLHDVGENLGIALSIIVSLGNPEYVVVNSVLTEAGEVFTGPVLFTLRRNTRPAFLERLKVEFHTLDPYAVAEGAAIEGMYRYIDEFFGAP